jgi:hypothetical protein
MREASGMTEGCLEISVKGKWVRVSTLELNGRHVISAGRWIKIASVHDEEWLQPELEDPDACIDILKARAAKSVKADIFTFTQRLPDTRPRYSYPMDWNSVAAIRLESFDGWWQNRPQETRKNVRRSAKRGVVTRTSDFDDDFVRGIVAINNESLLRQGKPFYHHGKGFDAVKKDYSSFAGRAEFIGAYFNDELIGFLQLVHMGKVAGVLELLTKTSEYDKRPANALIAKAVERCALQGVSYLTYGQYSYGNKGDSPLAEFKRRNGFDEILVPRFYVPLTAMGRICVACKLHRGLMGILPRRIIHPLLGVRRTWYKVAFARKPV